MATNPPIYVFKLSKATEFPGGVREVMSWIEDKKKEGNGFYHFRNHTPRNLRAGSIVLFEIEGEIIGQGVIEVTAEGGIP